MSTGAPAAAAKSDADLYKVLGEGNTSELYPHWPRIELRRVPLTKHLVQIGIRLRSRSRRPRAHASTLVKSTNTGDGGPRSDRLHATARPSTTKNQLPSVCMSTYPSGRPSSSWMRSIRHR